MNDMIAARCWELRPQGPAVSRVGEVPVPGRLADVSRDNAHADSVLVDQPLMKLNGWSR